MAAPRRPLPPFTLDAKAGCWLFFRLLAAANAARGNAPAWSAPELVQAARAAGVSTKADVARAQLRDVFGVRGLIERANSDAQDVAWRLSDAVRGAASPAPC